MNELELFKEFCYGYRIKKFTCTGCQYLKYCSKIKRFVVTFKEKFENIQIMIRKEKLKKLLKNG